MTRSSVALTLSKTAGIGLLGGIVGGVWVLHAIESSAEAHAETIEPMLRASYMCSAGMTASVLALLSVPAGALFGLCLGWIFILRVRAAERLPLP